MQQHRWLTLGVCLALSSCGMSSASKSEQVAETRGQLTLPPQISADFPIDRAAPDFDPDATLLNIAVSSAGGYLLTYNVLHASPRWLYPIVAGNVPTYRLGELVFVHWDGLTGVPTILARIPLATQPYGTTNPARAVDVGNAWLVVYTETNENGTWTDHVVTLGHDGDLGVPVELPPVCVRNDGVAGLARGGSSVLLTYPCGNGLLLDLAGGVLKSLTIATPESFGSPPKASPVYTPYGGQVAFNGIDYLVLYGFFTTAYPPSVLGKQLLGFPITPAGEVRPPITIAEPAVANGLNWSRPEGLVVSGNTFLALIGQARTGVGNDFSYRTVTEASDHTFTFAAERYLAGSPHSAGTPDDRLATPLVLNDHFAITRLPGGVGGIMQLVYPSSNPAIPDVTQPLPSGLLWNDSISSSVAASTDGKHLLLTSNAQGVRFDEALHAIDDPPAALISKPHEQFMPFFAAIGPRYLASWTEGVPNGLGYSGSFGAQLLAQRVSSTGAVLDPASLQLTRADQGYADALVTATPAWSAVLWNVDHGVTVSTADPPVVNPIPPHWYSYTGSEWGVGTDGVHLAVAFGNAAFLQLASDGTWSNVVDIGDGNAKAPTAPVLAFNAGSYALLWTDAGDPGERIVYGARVTAGLELLDSSPKDLFHFSSPDVPEYGGHTADGGIEVIASGDHFLLAWASVAGSTEQLHIARLSSTLALLDPGGVLVATQPFPQIGVVTRRVALGWDGSYNWVVWTDGEGGARSPLASLRGRRFSESLTPADAEPFLIASDLDQTSKVTLAVGEAGRSLVGYTRFLPSEYSYRVRARLLGSTPFADGVPCSNASQCEGGFCVASACSATSGAAGGGGGMVGGNTGGATDGGSGGTVGGNTGGATNGGIGGTVGGSTGGATNGGIGGTVGGNTGGATDGGSGGSVGATVGGAADGGATVGGNTGGDGTAGSGGSGGAGGRGGTVGATGGGGFAGAVEAAAGNIGNGGAVASGAGGGDDALGGGDGGSEISAGGEAGGDAGASDGGTRSGGASGVSGASAGHAGVGATSAGGGSKGHSCSIPVVGASSGGEDLVSFAALVGALGWLASPLSRRGVGRCDSRKSATDRRNRNLG